MKISSAVKLLVVLLAVVFLGNQFISSVYKPIKTETAVYYTSTDGLKITGVIIRNEILVDNTSNGVLHFVTSDGSRVAKNGVIADVYSTEDASITVSQINSVKNKIADIEEILSHNDIEAANLTLINEKVNGAIDELVRECAGGNYQNSSIYVEKLLSTINRRQAALGEAVDFSAQLEQLNNELASLNSSLPKPIGYVNAMASGYFVSKVDGYETVLKADALDSITPEFLNDIKPLEQEKEYIGKIVSDYEWYIAAEVTLNQSLSYKEGESLKISTSINTAPTLSAKVKKINLSDSGDRAVIIFACNEMSSELASMRTGPFTVINSEYSGLKVAKSALRVLDGVRGVYVVSGMQIKFVPIEIIYSTDEYVLCKKDADASLKLYDSVVVKGKNLYDGKIIS